MAIKEGFRFLPNNSFFIIRPFNTGVTKSIIAGVSTGKGFTCKGKSTKTDFTKKIIDYIDDQLVLD